jgi:hypothetical protein
LLFPWDVESGAATVYTWKQICDAIQKCRELDDSESKHKVWLLNSLACNLKIRPREKRLVNAYRFKDADILPDKFQNTAENDKIDASEREIAVNAQQMINFLRLRNHAGHPSKFKQRGEAHLMDLENTFKSIYLHSKKKTKKTKEHKSRNELLDYSEWPKKTQYWANTNNKSLREKTITEEEQKSEYSTQNKKPLNLVIEDTIEDHTLKHKGV